MLGIPSQALDAVGGHDAATTHHVTLQIKETRMLMTILIVVLILALIGGLPTWGHSRSWGYGPSGLLGVIVAIVLILWLLGRL